MSMSIQDAKFAPIYHDKVFNTQCFSQVQLAMAFSSDDLVKSMRKCEDETVSTMNEKDKGKQRLVDFDLIIYCFDFLQLNIDFASIISRLMMCSVMFCDV